MHFYFILIFLNALVWTMDGRRWACTQVTNLVGREDGVEIWNCGRDCIDG